jgi:hypothetical protein
MADLPPPISLSLVDGTTIVVPDSLNLLTTYILQEQGDWFEDEIKFLRKLVQPGQVVIDIGANYGVYALSLARRVGATGQVWAFEPATDTAGFLAQSIEANGTPWVRMETTALSDHEGTAWLRKPGQSELNSLSPPGKSQDPSEEGEGEEVPLSTLDGCKARYGWTAVDLLKIDAEGEEKRILAGGQSFFRETSPLVMFELKEGASLHLELLECFQALGYGCYRLVPGLDVLVPFNPEQGVDGYLLNLFAAKPDRAAALASEGWLVTEEQIGKPGIPLQPLPQPNGMAYQEALAAWDQAHDGDLPVAERVAALRRSYQLLCALTQPNAPASRWLSLARVGLALGEREAAMNALAHLGTALQEGQEPELEEPFLTPHPEVASITPGVQKAQWLEAAVLEAQEIFGSFSSFFTGPSAFPRLQQLRDLGLGSPAMELRLALVQRRFPDQATVGELVTGLADKEISAVRPWFDFLELETPLRCLDVGAMGLGDQADPWVRWAKEGCAEVIGFEPLQEECKRLNQQFAHLGKAVRYLPYALGDGEEHTLHVTNMPMTSSLYPPARATVDLFPGLGELMQVERHEVLRTHRLDDLNEVRPADFLKLDAQGAELMVLQQAKATLADVALVECEVEFVELYEGQPLMADVDAFLRSEGYCFLKFTSLQGRPYKPLAMEAQSLNPISQLLWGDAVYVRDFRLRAGWTDRQLKAACFLLHELYKAADLVSLLLTELDHRNGTDWQSLYLASLLMSEPGFNVN